MEFIVLGLVGLGVWKIVAMVRSDRMRLSLEKRCTLVGMCAQVELYIRDRQTEWGLPLVSVDTDSTRQRLQMAWQGNKRTWANYVDMMDADFYAWRHPLVGARLVQRIARLNEEIGFKTWAHML